MKIIKSGNSYNLYDLQETYDKLPVGNYVLKFNPVGGFYLSRKENFRMPGKIYGDLSATQRWLKTYSHTGRNLGIALVGTKGSGKTLMAQKLCIESGMPVVMINEQFNGGNFIDFISNPALDNSIIFIDEYEKIYSDKYDENGNSEDSQRDFLGIMDGNFPGRRIFLLTMNEDRLNKYMKNRLSRIRYRKDFSGLDKSTMNDIMDDILVNKSHKKSIEVFFNKLGVCTMDVLIPLINEMNLFNEDAEECGKHLNVECEEKYFTITEKYKDKEVKCNELYISLNTTRNLQIQRLWQEKKGNMEIKDYPFYDNIDITSSEVEFLSNGSVRVTTIKNKEYLLVPSSYTSVKVF